jgi:hypothetical protein
VPLLLLHGGGGRRGRLLLCQQAWHHQRDLPSWPPAAAAAARCRLWTQRCCWACRALLPRRGARGQGAGLARWCCCCCRCCASCRRSGGLLVAGLWGDSGGWGGGVDVVGAVHCKLTCRSRVQALRGAPTNALTMPTSVQQHATCTTEEEGFGTSADNWCRATQAAHLVAATCRWPCVVHPAPAAAQPASHCQVAPATPTATAAAAAAAAAAAVSSWQQHSCVADAQASTVACQQQSQQDTTTVRA